MQCFVILCHCHTFLRCETNFLHDLGPVVAFFCAGVFYENAVFQPVTSRRGFVINQKYLQLPRLILLFLQILCTFLLVFSIVF